MPTRAQDEKLKKNSNSRKMHQKIFITPSVRKIAIVIVTWKKAAKSKVIIKIVIPIDVKM